MNKYFSMILFLILTQTITAQVSNFPIFPAFKPNYVTSPYGLLSPKPLPNFLASEYKIFTKINNTIFVETRYKSKQSYNTDCQLAERVSIRSTAYDSTRERLTYDTRKRLSQIKGENFKSNRADVFYTAQFVYKTNSNNADTFKLFNGNDRLPFTYDVMTYTGDLITKRETITLDSFASTPKYVTNEVQTWSYDNSKRVVAFLRLALNEDIYLLENKVQLDTIISEKYKYNTEGDIIEREVAKPTTTIKLSKSVFAISKTNGLVTDIREIITASNKSKNDTLRRVYTYMGQRLSSENWYLNAVPTANKTLEYVYNAQGFLTSITETNRNETTGVQFSKFRETYTVDDKGFAKEFKKEQQIGGAWEDSSSETMTPTTNCNNISSTVTPSVFLEKIKLSPNPVSDILHLETDLLDFEVKIYNLQGQLLKEVRNDNTINVSQLPNSLYFLQVFDKGVLKSVNKFMKK